MKILHILPHLGGGVGKAHAALCNVLQGQVEQTYVLLEKPVMNRYIDAIVDAGAFVVQADDPKVVHQYADTADIVQIEWWNHRVWDHRSLLGRRPDRLMLWSHQSVPVPAPILRGVDRAVGTSSVCNLPYTINSGFGFDSPQIKTSYGSRIGYLGTVDFKKMSPLFFDVVGKLHSDASVYGHPSTEVDEYAQWTAPSIKLMGHTDDPQAALQDIDIFFYPLQPDHYGTGENALIEAMSVGCCPVVLNNACEASIIQDGHTGYICDTAEQCVATIQRLLFSPDIMRAVGQKAAAYVAKHKTPLRSAAQFLVQWTDMLADKPRNRRWNGESDGKIIEYPRDFPSQVPGQDQHDIG